MAIQGCNIERRKGLIKSNEPRFNKLRNQWSVVVVCLHIIRKVADVPAFDRIDTNCFYKISEIPKCQDLGAQNTDAQYLCIQVFNSRTNKASQTVQKTHASSSEASKKTCETAWSWNNSRKGAKALYAP